MSDTLAKIKGQEIVKINDGGKNTAQEVRSVLDKIADYSRQSSVTTITQAQCTPIEDRTYSYTMSDPKTTTLEVDGAGAAGGGVLLNNIIPHSDIIDGQELLVIFKNGGGLTFLTKGGITANIIFIVRSKVSPTWGADNFIAQKSDNTRGDIIDEVAVGYETNLKVLLKWNSSLSRWIEIHRSGGNTY